jgi:3-hydroxyacyl-[acyl-carrier-protein] dehydratase
MQEDILNAIPHRPPFLFVDEIIEQADDHIVTRKRIDPEEPFFKGHYPAHPIMPGVLVCECVFQTGAILMSKKYPTLTGQVPVMSRIQNVKFKNPVYPGSVLEIRADYMENIGPAHYMKGKVQVDGQTVVTVEFTVMLMEEKL